ncbi:SusC/RagA family TonB-linked outer membrane protein [Ginsengibacter hankyongi]|uniref:SusC/RagA family TonB-linked outer membrane protein n=1 Tax=Ginsengibacter hankyongi TaxID=2607284 RepID=A0A5J5ICL0_9BACT|nr:SusC/RagA family TonB-linked outer membrane protein [Ginsengibacter hankyongi]KAA9037195.1 SusC/RagA family TonB-linked outer membrane protein [Ginsengibacter hankyongi]
MKQLPKKLLLVLTLFFSATIVFAQQRQITGTVKDNDGNPLSNVSYLIKGTKIGGITDATGHFSIKADRSATLVFSSVGFSTKEIKVGNQSKVAVNLASSEGELNEVVVTALGIKRERRSIGYAVSTIKAEELTKAGSTMNPFLALYGKAAGVGVNTGAAGPMGGLKINIRGAASLNPNQNTRPLFVVDGVIISDRTTSIGGSTGAGYDYGSNINDINSEDIASIDILKGAKATVLYGTDAANGVVLITTKSGRNAKGLGMTGFFQYSIEKPKSYLDLQNEYGLGNNIYDTSYTTLNGKTVRAIPNRRYSFGPKFDGADVMFYDSSIVKNSPHNSYDDLFRTGSSYTSNVAISGSSDKGSLRASYTNYAYNDITSPNAWQKRNTFSFNGNIKASKFASFDLISNVYNIVSQNRRENNAGSIAWGFPDDYDYNQMYNLYRDRTGYKRDLTNYGVPTAGVDIGNYLWDLNKNRVKDDKFHIITSAKTTLNFTKHVFFVGQFGLDYDNTNYSSEISVDRILPTVSGGGFSIKKENNTIQTYQGLLNYDNSFMNDNFRVSGFGGFIYRLRTSESLGSNTIGGLNFPGWYSFNNQAGTPSAGNAYLLRSYSRGSDVLYSAVASATLSWKNEFYMDLQGRQDWNSTLPPQNNKYFFPGASLTWNYTDRFSVPKMNSGQLRFSWADVGNGTTRYFANNQYGLGYISGTGAQAVVVTPPGNLLPGALKPERKREFEIGINNSFFAGNRLTFDLSYYTNNRYNQIISLPISQTSSSGGLLINVANMRTYGFEFSVTGTPILTKNIRWDVTVNGARQGSKVLDLYGDLKEYTYANLINGSSASIRADLNRPFGDIKMNDYTKDDKGERVVNANGVYTLNADPTQMKVFGNIMPKLLGGVLSDFRYKNITFRVALDYKYGGTVFSYTNERMYGLGELQNTLKYRDEAHGGLSYYIDNSGAKVAWQSNQPAPAQSADGHVYHDGVILPGVMLNADGKYVTNTKIASASDYYLTYINDLSTSFPPDNLFKNDYIKVREIALSYQLPQKLANKIKMQALSITAAARNLFYIYKTIPNIDVESALGADSYVENTIFPGQQTFSLGVNLSF